MQVYVPYPKWLYHATEKARLVHSEEEHEALGAAWVEHPDDVVAEPEAVEVPEDTTLADMTDEQLVAYAETDKRALEAQAKEELGIDLDLRYGAPALAAMVRKAVEDSQE